MALSGILEKLDSAPEGLKEHYKQGDDGKYYLDVDGYTPKAKLDEFRANNKKLYEEVSSLKARYDGIDPEDHKRLRVELEEVKAGKGETIGTLLKTHENRLQQQYGEKLSKTARERDEYKAKAEGYRAKVAQGVLSRHLERAVEKERLKLSGPGAFRDLLARAGAVWEADPDLDKISYRGQDDEAPALSQWVRDLVRDPEHSHLFEGGAGGGAGGGTRRAAGGKIVLTAEQIQQPTPEQYKAMLSGNYITEQS